jgi:hypothetical protein
MPHHITSLAAALGTQVDGLIDGTGMQDVLDSQVPVERLEESERSRAVVQRQVDDLRTSLNDARDVVLDVRRLLGNDAGSSKASAVLAHLAASIATELRSPAAAKADKGTKRAAKPAAKAAKAAPKAAPKRGAAKRAPARAHALGVRRSTTDFLRRGARRVDGCRAASIPPVCRRVHPNAPRALARSIAPGRRSRARSGARVPRGTTPSRLPRRRARRSAGRRHQRIRKDVDGGDGPLERGVAPVAVLDHPRVDRDELPHLLG